MAVVVTVQALVRVTYCERVMRKVHYEGGLGVIWGSLECLKWEGQQNYHCGVELEG
jgi:hypothetical protein